MKKTLLLLLFVPLFFFSACKDEEPIHGCLDSQAENYNPQASLDNNSCEYLDIGATYKGGIVFYIDETGQHGLVAALEDITEGSNMGGYGTAEGFEWGCYQQIVNGADGKEIGRGYQNTLDIVAQNCQTENGGITAAQATLNYTSEGFTDWYLPSFKELQEMYNTIGNGGSQGNIGDFETSDFPHYWSSSESSLSNLAFYVEFNYGDDDSSGKSGSRRVRAVRAF